jgi:hypothetical protein
VADTVYVSGARVRNEKRPDASVVTEAVCDGLETVTTTPAIGAKDVASTTEPVRPPVVPASAHVPWLTKATSSTRAVTICRRDLRIIKYLLR